MRRLTGQEIRDEVWEFGSVAIEEVSLALLRPHRTAITWRVFVALATTISLE